MHNFIFIINIWKGNILIHVQFCNCLSFYVAKLLNRENDILFTQPNSLYNLHSFIWFVTIYKSPSLFDLSQSTNHHRYPKLVTSITSSHFNPKLVTPTWYVERHVRSIFPSFFNAYFVLCRCFCTKDVINIMLLHFQYRISCAFTIWHFSWHFVYICILRNFEYFSSLRCSFKITASRLVGE